MRTRKLHTYFSNALIDLYTKFLKITATAILAGAGISASTALAPAYAFDMSHGKLYGLVTDPYGTPIANTKVVITSSLLGFSKTMITNAEGRVRVSYLPTSDYTANIVSGEEKYVAQIPVYAGYSSGVHFVVSAAPDDVLFTANQSPSDGSQVLQSRVQIPPIRCDHYGNLCSNRQTGTRGFRRTTMIGVIKQEP